jgi:hypothetical protein
MLLHFDTFAQQCIEHAFQMRVRYVTPSTITAILDAMLSHQKVDFVPQIAKIKGRIVSDALTKLW